MASTCWCPRWMSLNQKLKRSSELGSPHRDEYVEAFAPRPPWNGVKLGNFLPASRNMSGLLLSSEAGKGSSKKIRRIFSEREVTLSWNRKVTYWGQGLTKLTILKSQLLWDTVTFTSGLEIPPYPFLFAHSGQVYPILFSVNSFYLIYIQYSQIG